MDIYFSDNFNVKPEVLEEYGAFNISLVTDLPLFIDPFLLFNSKKQKYKELHNNIIKYLKFLRDKSLYSKVDKGLLKAWFTFSEVEQNWFGFSRFGNSGNGLGMKFARNLNRNLNKIFNDFGKERITKDSHLEKLCLFNSGVGKDNISDFTTNLIKDYLLKYTEEFAKKNIDSSMLKKINIEKVRFNYYTETWESDFYILPVYKNEYVILTPKDILTKDNTFINSYDMYNTLDTIINSIENDVLRAKLNNYLRFELLKDMTKKERKKVYEDMVKKFPQLIDYYIREKELKKEEALNISKSKVLFSETFFIENVIELINKLQKTEFYNLKQDSFSEAYEKVLCLKDVIENKDGYKIFYVKGKPIKRELDIKIMFKLVLFNIIDNCNLEVNNGRGTVDFKDSNSFVDKNLINFKLASNKKLKKKLQNQVEICKKSNNIGKSITAILYYNEAELNRANKILNDLKLSDSKNIIMIAACSDNKLSASIV